LTIPVTTGDSYTVAVAVAAITRACAGTGKQAARCMEIDFKNATAAVVGATGAIGSVCAELLAADVPQVILLTRCRSERSPVPAQARVEQVRSRVQAAGAQAIVAADTSALRQADLVITVTSALQAILAPGDLKPGCVVSDVARPRNVSRVVIEQRDDVLVIEGGMVEVPGCVDFHFDFGLPPRMAYACMAETMTLALEGRYECFTLGKEIALEHVQEIAALAERHGFRLGSLRSFERAVSDDEIERIRDNARRRRTDH
jgi:fatty aldehyde-generating acyl-ACP reductase